RAFAHRRIVVAATLPEAVVALRSAGSLAAICHRRRPPVVPLFRGEEAVRVNVYRDLHEWEPTFRDAFKRCVDAAGDLGRRMKEALYPAAGREEDAARALHEEGLAPLATFAVQSALARLWQSWGLAFETPIGDGVGALDVRSAADVLRGLPADPDRLFLELGCGPIALRSAA